MSNLSISPEQLSVFPSNSDMSSSHQSGIAHMLNHNGPSNSQPLYPPLPQQPAPATSSSSSQSKSNSFSTPSLPERRETYPNLNDLSRGNSDYSGILGLNEEHDPKKRMSLPGDFMTPGSHSPTISATGGGSAGGKNGAMNGVEKYEDDDDVEDVKKKRSGSGNHGHPTLTSCEACRKGKRRCEPSPLVPVNHPDAAKLPCARCRRFALECVRVRVSRRKGPAPVDLSAISDAVHGYGGVGSSNGGIMGNGNISTGIAPLSSTSLNDATSELGNNGYIGNAEDRRRSSAMSVADFYQHNRSDSMGNMTSTSPAFPILAVSPSLNMAAIPENLDQVVASSVIDNIIGLFFDYVYPVTPCLHRPTFIAKLQARLDKTDPVFFALVLCVLASTLVQVPRSLVNLDKAEVESLARRCVRVAKAKISYLWEESIPVESSLVVISYLEGIVQLYLGNNTAHVICTATANQLALAMRLNEEASYDNLDPIESEIRRRIYWLLFQADKSSACLRARTMTMRLEDAASLRLPAEVDDEQITSGGILPQPVGKTPIISGFNIVTNLFRILNDALILQRRRAPPTVDSILADLSNVNDLREKVMRTTQEAATPLQLRRAMDSRVSSPAHDWEAKLQERFLDFFHSAGDEEHALNSFLVLQGNILVTQQVVRLVLLQTKEALLSQLALITQMPVQGISSLAGMQASEPAEDIACELLDGLNSLPVECVATNGPSLVQKVRFVAIQLMECSVSPSPTTARAQKLLMQFLSVLSVIEGMYTFGRDISAE